MALAPMLVPSRSVYTEAPTYLPSRRLVAGAFLFLAAVAGSGIQIFPPTAQMNLAGTPPTSSTSGDPMLFVQPPAYVDQAQQVYVNRGRNVAQFLLASPPPGATINVPSLAMALTAYVPVSGYMQFILYQPPDDGWFEEVPEQENSKAALRFAFLSGSTSAGGVVIAPPRGNLFLTDYVPNVTASGNGATVNVPAGSLALTAYTPTVPPLNIVLQIPVAQMHATAFPTNQIFFTPPTGALTLKGYAPVVLGGQPVSTGPVPTNLGYKVSFRNFSLEEMASRAWGSEFNAPDHDVYKWSNGRGFDSTDMGTTGIYKKGTSS